MILMIGLVADLISFNRQLIEITLEKVDGWSGPSAIRGRWKYRRSQGSLEADPVEGG
jgi:hypothetical protein